MKLKKFNVVACAIIGGLIIGGCQPSNTGSNNTSDTTSSLSTSSSQSSGSSSTTSSITSSSSPVIDDGYNWTVPEGTALQGELSVYASTPNATDVLKIKISNIEYPAAAQSGARMVIKHSGTNINSDNAMNVSNMFGINGIEYGRLFSNGTTGYSFAEYLFKKGENSIYMISGQAWGGATYDFSRPHGIMWQGDKEDFKMKNLYLDLPNGNTLSPSKIRGYYPKQPGSVGYEIVESLYDPDVTYIVGDGDSSSASYYNHPNPRYNIPVKIEFVFDYDKPTYRNFKIDSTLISDGSHVMELINSNTVIRSSNITIDNIGPAITTTFVDKGIYTKKSKIPFSAFDTVSGIAEEIYLMDGNPYNLSNESSAKYLDLNSLSNGVHSFFVYLKDAAGNINSKTYDFYIGELGLIDYGDVNATLSNLSGTTSSSHALDQKINTYKTTALTYEVANGIALNDGQLSYSADNSTLANYKTTTGVPYKQYRVDVTGKTGEILLQFDGETVANEKLYLGVIKPDGKIDKLASIHGSGLLSAKVKIADYVKDNYINVIVGNDFVNNGSDTIIWSTDTQHYTKFDALNINYTKTMQYAADQYNLGKIGYLVHTGDIVEDTPASKQEKQWQVADGAFKILEDNAVPFGIVSGNHDVGTSLVDLDYSYYTKYFGHDRFINSSAFGGSLKNNQSHYDLVTIANTDFIFLYLGYGVEAEEDTIRWANAILAKYRHRNAVLATHSYLTNGGGWDANSRASIIYDKIVKPNENVIMLLCGHVNGAEKTKKTIGTRSFWEIMSDYQFVDKSGTGSLYQINGYPNCNGDGFIRLMKFDGTNMINTAYSVVNGKNDPISVAADNFTIAMSIKNNERIIKQNEFRAILIGDKTSTADIGANGTFSVNISSNPVIAEFISSNGYVNYAYIQIK